jgi:hypothetical protein
MRPLEFSAFGQEHCEAMEESIRDQDSNNDFLSKGPIIQYRTEDGREIESSQGDQNRGQASTGL